MTVFSVVVAVCWAPVPVRADLAVTRFCQRTAVAIVRFADGHEEGRCDACLSAFARHDTPKPR